MTTNPNPEGPPDALRQARGQAHLRSPRHDPSYLAWFCDNVDDNEGLKGAIRDLPGFAGASGKCRHQVQAGPPACRGARPPNMGVDPRLSRKGLDRLCREILHPPAEE